jgi:uncharacterized protein YjbJ (UPF0337 family)
LRDGKYNDRKNKIMSTDDKSSQMAREYSIKAKKAMDKVTDDQTPEVKERVEKVQKTVEKTVDSAKDAVN